MLRKSVVVEIGGFEESSRDFYEDQAFLVKMYLKAPVFVSDECLSRYRLHPDSACAVGHRAGLYHPVRRNFLKWFEKYLKREGVGSAGVSRALRRALREYERPVLFRWAQWVTRLTDRTKNWLGRMRDAALGR